MNPSATPAWSLARMAATAGVALALAILALVSPPTAQAGMVPAISASGAAIQASGT